MRSRLLRLPYFPFLLPLFFVLHGFVENAAFISLRNCYGLLVFYLLIAVVLYGMLYLFYRNAAKAALALVTLQIVSFFFGPLQDLLVRYAVWLSRSGVILPLLAILVTAIFIALKKTTRKLAPLVMFFNVLLLIYLLIDGTKAFLITTHPSGERLGVTTPFTEHVSSCDTCSYPDVYLLLMDEYASTASLKTWYGYDNRGLDSFLREKGFHIQQGSHSNYNYTSFSMASILNMSYLKGLGAGNLVTINDYASCGNLIRNSSVVRQFTAHGYGIVNFSIFDLGEKPSDVNLHLLPVKANLISGQTLWARVRRDIISKIYALPVPMVKQQIYQVRDDNDRFIDGVEKESKTSSTHPRFIYAHLEMPHSPHFYDRSGRLKKPEELGDTGVQPYLDYLPYTNGVIKRLVTAIRQNTHDSAVIILMGDHGARYEAPGDTGHIHDFQNLNAIYFPGGNYDLLYDSLSGVNQFRVVFSRIFRQNIPLLKDSAVFLTDRNF